jgi:hypothetical protein
MARRAASIFRIDASLAVPERSASARRCAAQRLPRLLGDDPQISPLAKLRLTPSRTRQELRFASPYVVLPASGGRTSSLVEKLASFVTLSAIEDV